MPSNSSSPSHRRTLSSKSLAAGNGKVSLAYRPPSHPKLSALGKKRNTAIEFSNEQSIAIVSQDDNDMTFLQYCPICDKQILVPNSQVLYCSESCRRKDSLSTTPPPQLNLALRFSTTPISPSFKMAFEDNRSRRSPLESPIRIQSSITSASLPATVSKPPELHGFKPDLDPTEWKPNSTRLPVKNNSVSAFPTPFFMPDLVPSEEYLISNEGAGGNSETTVPDENKEKPGLPRRQSAAFGYLAQFHRSANSFLSLVSKRPPGLKSHNSASSVSIPGVVAGASDLETPAMSLDRSSGYSSAASSGISIAIHRPDDHNAEELMDDDGGAGSGDTLLDEGLAFGKKNLSTVQPGDIKDNTAGLLNKANN